MKKLIIAIVGALALVNLHAETLGWANNGTAAANFYDAANWTNSTGEAATMAPTNSNYSAVFPDLDRTTRTVNLLSTAYADRNMAPVTDTLAGGEFWRLVLNKGVNSWGHSARSVKFADVNDFKGEWYSKGSW